MQAKALELRNNSRVEIDGEVYVVTSHEHHTPGKGRAVVRLKIKNVKTGRVIDKTFSSTEKVELADLEYRKMQYLYKEGDDFISAAAGSFRPGEHLQVPVRQVLDIAKDIDGQIYTRDFQMVRQSDMIVSMVPALPDGSPGLSSGVERELQHAFDHSRDVYVVWHPEKPPSPFITETATKVFRTTQEALAHFEAKGFLIQGNLFGH